MSVPLSQGSLDPAVPATSCLWPVHAACVATEGRTKPPQCSGQPWGAGSVEAPPPRGAHPLPVPGRGLALFPNIRSHKGPGHVPHPPALGAPVGWCVQTQASLADPQSPALHLGRHLLYSWVSGRSWAQGILSCLCVPRACLAPGSLTAWPETPPWAKPGSNPSSQGA